MMGNVSEGINKIAEAAKEHLIQTNQLIITLKEDGSIPKVFYKGEEVKRVTNITFDWHHDDDEIAGLTYGIERYESNETRVFKDKIERRSGSDL